MCSLKKIFVSCFLLSFMGSVYSMSTFSLLKDSDWLTPDQAASLTQLFKAGDAYFRSGPGKMVLHEALDQSQKALFWVYRAVPTLGLKESLLLEKNQQGVNVIERLAQAKAAYLIWLFTHILPQPSQFIAMTKAVDPDMPAALQFISFLEENSPKTESLLREIARMSKKETLNNILLQMSFDFPADESFIQLCMKNPKLKDLSILATQILADNDLVAQHDRNGMPPFGYIMKAQNIPAFDIAIEKIRTNKELVKELFKTSKSYHSALEYALSDCAKTPEIALKLLKVFSEEDFKMMPFSNMDVILSFVDAANASSLSQTQKTELAQLIGKVMGAVYIKLSENINKNNKTTVQQKKEQEKALDQKLISLKPKLQQLSGQPANQKAPQPGVASKPVVESLKDITQEIRLIQQNIESMLRS